MVTNNDCNIATAASNTVLQGQGVGTAPAFSTATYPATTTANQILYSSATNTVGGLATANSGVLSTSASGVPSIDVTNFAVLSTGLQLKGNNTNTAPPAGFIGERIVATVGNGSPVSISNNSVTNITSVALTAGVWDISAVAGYTGGGGAVTGTQTTLTISTANNTAGTLGDARVDTPTVPTVGSDMSMTIPNVRVLLSGNTTYYMNVIVKYTVGTVTGYGRISAVRVG